MDYRYQDLSFVRKDHKKIVGRLYLPREKGKYRTAIFAHGFNGQYGVPERTSLWGVPLGQIYSEDSIRTDIYRIVLMLEMHRWILFSII